MSALSCRHGGAGRDATVTRDETVRAQFGAISISRECRELLIFNKCDLHVHLAKPLTSICTPMALPLRARASELAL